MSALLVGAPENTLGQAAGFGELILPSRAFRSTNGNPRHSRPSFASGSLLS